MALTTEQIVHLLAYSSYPSVLRAVKDPGKVNGDLAVTAVGDLGDDGRQVLAEIAGKRAGSRMTTRGVRIQGALANRAWRSVWNMKDPRGTAKAVAWFHLAQADVDQRLEAWVASNAFTAPPAPRVSLSKFQLMVAEAAAEQNWGRLTDLLRRRRSDIRWAADLQMCVICTDSEVDCLVQSGISKAAGDFTAGITATQLRFGARSLDLDADAGKVVVGRMGL